MISGKEYYYYVGDSNVVIKDNKEKKTVVPYSDLLGITSDDVERGKWKKTLKITPGNIAEYINNEDL